MRAITVFRLEEGAWRAVHRHGDFPSRQDLADKIEAFTILYNQTAKPYRWTYDGTPLKAA